MPLLLRCENQSPFYAKNAWLSKSAEKQLFPEPTGTENAQSPAIPGNVAGANRRRRSGAGRGRR
jgi:hypothetical protein